MLWKRLVPIGLSWLLLTGCHTYYPYPYGHPGHPGQYGQYGLPPGTVLPSTVAPNAFPPAELQPSQPQSGGVGAQEFQQPRLPSGQGSDEANLPPNPVSQEYDSNASSSSPDPFLGASQNEYEHEGSLASSNELQEPTADLRSASSWEGDEGEEAFVSPAPFKQASSHQELTTNRQQPPEQSRPNPYLYDEKSYSWLRGVVDFDEEHDQWRITYNPEPDKNDKYGGSFVLTNDPLLYQIGLLPNDVVLVEGRIDHKMKDRFGKATYRIHQADRLVPDTQAGP